MRGSSTPGITGLKCRGRRPKNGLDALAKRCVPRNARSSSCWYSREIHDRRIADGVEAAGDAGVDLAERDLLRDRDRGVEAGAAGALHVEAGRRGIEARRQHALAHQVEVLRMLEHRAAGDVAEALARDAVLGDQRLQHRGVHVLVADARVGAVTAREGNAHAADDGDATNL